MHHVLSTINGEAPYIHTSVYMLMTDKPFQILTENFIKNLLLCGIVVYPDRFQI